MQCLQDRDAFEKAEGNHITSERNNARSHEHYFGFAMDLLFQTPKAIDKIHLSAEY